MLVLYYGSSFSFTILALSKKIIPPFKVSLNIFSGTLVDIDISYFCPWRVFPFKIWYINFPIRPAPIIPTFTKFGVGSFTPGPLKISNNFFEAEFWSNSSTSFTEFFGSCFSEFLALHRQDYIKIHCFATVSLTNLPFN